MGGSKDPRPSKTALKMKLGTTVECIKNVRLTSNFMLRRHRDLVILR